MYLLYKQSLHVGMYLCPVLFIYTTESDVSGDMKDGSIMLTNGNYTAGVLQVFYNSSWVDVCTSMATAHVACRQLGFYSVLGVYDDMSAIG